MTVALSPPTAPSLTIDRYIDRVDRLPASAPGRDRFAIDVPHVSPSQIKSYQRCAAAYYFHYGENLAGGSDTSLVRGSAIHEAAHAYGAFQRKAFEAGQTPDHDKLLVIAIDHAQAYLTQELKKIAKFATPFVWKGPYSKAAPFTEATLREHVTACVTMLAEMSWRSLAPVALEEGYLIHFKDKATLPVLAYVDRIEHYTTPDNALAAQVVDIKTGSRKSPLSLRLDAALTAYAVGYQVTTGIPTTRKKYENLICNATPLIEEVQDTITDAQVGRLYRLARGLTLARQHGEFLPVDDDQTCSGCAYAARCTELYQ